eukprot:320381-Prymnesium_polylepis.2
MAPPARLHFFFSHAARTIGQEQQKADVPHAHHKVELSVAHNNMTKRHCRHCGGLFCYTCTYDK